MPTPLSNFTYQQVIRDIRDRLNQFTDDKFPPKLIRSELYLTLTEIIEMMGIANLPEYKSSFTLVSTDTGLQYTKPGSSIPATSFTLSTMRVVIPLTGSGISWVKNTGFNLSFVGMPFYMQYTEGTSKQCTGTISTILTDPDELDNPADGGTTAVLVFDTVQPGGYVVPTGNITSANLLTFNVDTYQTDTIYLENYSEFKFIDKITSLDDSISGPCFDTVNEVRFNSLVHDRAISNYSDVIIYYREGNVIRFDKGTEITAYGTRKVSYIRLPIKPIANTEYVDCKDTLLTVLKEKVMLKILETLSGQGKLNQKGEQTLATMKQSSLEEKKALNKSAEN